MERQRNTHHVFRIMYHFVWIPKYRRSLKNIIEPIGYDYNIEIVELEILLDPIHMVVQSEPKKSPSDWMQVLKVYQLGCFSKCILK